MKPDVQHNMLVTMLETIDRDIMTLQNKRNACLTLLNDAIPAHSPSTKTVPLNEKQTDLSTGPTIWQKAKIILEKHGGRKSASEILKFFPAEGWQVNGKSPDMVIYQALLRKNEIFKRRKGKWELLTREMN